MFNFVVVVSFCVFGLKKLALTCVRVSWANWTLTWSFFVVIGAGGGWGRGA